MNKKRKPISKRLRFEIFKRDSFTCQYCGMTAPTVLLHIDHITPVSAGGGNTLLNLVTSCEACNIGKSDKKLDDVSALVRQITAAKEINEQLEQIKLMAKWQRDLNKINDKQIDIIDSIISRESGHYLTEEGRKNYKKLIKKYGLQSLVEAAETSFDQYLHDKTNKDQIHKAITSIPKIAYWNDKRLKDKSVDKLLHICNTAKKYWYGHNRQRVWDLSLDAHKNSHIDLDDILSIARRVNGITTFENALRQLISEVRSNG